MILKSHSCAYIQRKPRYMHPNVQSSTYLQQPRYGSNLNEIMPFAATQWTQRLSCKVKSERETQIPYDITYIRNLKRIQMNLFTKETHRFGKQTFGYQKVKLVGQGYIRRLGLTYIHCVCICVCAHAYSGISNSL